MDASHWGLYRGTATLSAIVTESVLALENAVTQPDCSSKVRRVLDELLYKAVAEARAVLPHAISFAQAVFDGKEKSAGAADGPPASQQGTHHVHSSRPVFLHTAVTPIRPWEQHCVIEAEGLETRVPAVAHTASQAGTVALSLRRSLSKSVSCADSYTVPHTCKYSLARVIPSSRTAE
jgi:hypothetical protein